MKRITAILAALLIVFSVKAQDVQEPVTIENNLRYQGGDTLVVTVTFSVDSNWMVYDSLGGEVGPIPISIDHGDLKENLISVKKPKLKHKLTSASCRTESISANHGKLISSRLQRLMSFSRRYSISSTESPRPPFSSILRPTATVIMFALHL